MLQYEKDYTDGSRTRSRNLRRDVRNELGTSSSDLPDVIAVLRAARALAALLDNASGTAFGLSVHRFSTGEDVPIGDAISLVLTAREVERQRRDYT